MAPRFIQVDTVVLVEHDGNTAIRDEEEWPGLFAAWHIDDG